MSIAVMYNTGGGVGLAERLVLRLLRLRAAFSEKMPSMGAMVQVLRNGRFGDRPSISSSVSLEGGLRGRFEGLLKEHGALISRICFSYAADGEDYQDLRQDVLLNIWRGLENFRGDASGVTWVYRVALNTCVSTVRKRSRRPAVGRLDDIPFDLPAEGEDEGMRERLEWLHRLISELGPVDKAIVTMWLDERSYEEIAEVTGVSRNNVGLRLHRIRERWKGMV